MIRAGYSYDAEDGVWWKKGSEPGVVAQAREEGRKAGLEEAARRLTKTRVGKMEAALREIADTFEIDWHEAQEIAREALGTKGEGGE